jgi:hypothetical protein
MTSRHAERIDVVDASKSLQSIGVLLRFLMPALW